MYCTKCGAKLPHDARFCMNCGKPVSAIASAKAVELKASPANAAVPSASSEEAAAPASSSAKAAVSAFALEAADADFDRILDEVEKTMRKVEPDCTLVR